VPTAFDANEFLKYVTAMFALVNPIAAVPLVIVFTPNANWRERLSLAVVATLTVFVTLSLSALFGKEILRLFAISSSVFRVAGGLVVVLTALGMIRPPASSEGQLLAKPGYTPAIVPLGIPLLAGPGAISAVIAFANYPHPQWRIFANHAFGLAIVSVVTFLCLAGATLVEKVLGATGMRIITQVMGLILLSIGLEMMIHGLAGHLGWQVAPD
jgi:multiple antibiotic resistance protein